MSAGATTGIAVVVTMKSPNTGFVVDVTGTGISRIITITMENADFYMVDSWLIDDPAAPNTKTLSPPDGDSTISWQETTDSSGVLTKTITHSGTGTWYLAVSIGGIVVVSDELAFT